MIARGARGSARLGLPKYMTDRPLPGGLETKLHLHARRLTLPREGQEDLVLEARLPGHMQRAFEMMGFDGDGEVDWEALAQ